MAEDTVEAVNPASNKEDSLKKRYVYKLGANIIGIPVSLVVQAIIPRILGPAVYSFHVAFTTIISI